MYRRVVSSRSLRSWLLVGPSLLTLVGCAAETDGETPRDVAPRSRPAVEAEGDWPRRGGPNGDFVVDVDGLAAGWPPEGPPLVWSRPLGEGYSTIVAEAGVLYTMYRKGDSEVVVALGADDGDTIWERAYAAPTRDGHATQFGSGPNATPLLVDGCLVTLGYSGALHGLDPATGAVRWSHDLIDAWRAPVLQFGYSASPIAHDGKAIVLVGGDHGAVAFDPADGSTVWSGPASTVSYATPIVADVDGQQQLIYFTADAIVGLDAADGTKLWDFPVRNQYDNNATDPIWGKDGLLWVATQLDGGTRALRLTRSAGDTVVEEVWASNQLSIHFWNALRLGDHVYASIGSNASVLAAVDIRSGEIVWRERGFEQVNFVHAGGRTILLDANGELALVELSPAGLTRLAQTRIAEGPTWSPPTLVGTRLFVRDKQSIRAYELGGSRSDS